MHERLAAGFDACSLPERKRRKKEKRSWRLERIETQTQTTELQSDFSEPASALQCQYAFHTSSDSSTAQTVPQPQAQDLLLVPGVFWDSQLYGLSDSCYNNMVSFDSLELQIQIKSADTCITKC
jgi:hypothetical protein